MILELDNITVYRDRRPILRHFDFQLAKGEKVAIIGANGAGKSTLLDILTSKIRVAYSEDSSIKIFGSERWTLEEVRRRMGMLIPDQLQDFDPDDLAGDIVLAAFQNALGRTWQMDFTPDEEVETRTALERAGIAHLAERPFGQLSSGERRRILLARALLFTPDLLVLDEPTTALDLPSKWQLMDTITQFCQSGGGLMLVTHDPSEILPEIDRVVLLRQGQILADGPKREVLTDPLMSQCFDTPVTVHWHHEHCQILPTKSRE